MKFSGPLGNGLQSPICLRFPRKPCRHENEWTGCRRNMKRMEWAAVTARARHDEIRRVVGGLLVLNGY